MKINFLSPHLKISGGVRVLLVYANLLAKMGHDVRVIVQSRNWLRRRAANFLNFKPKWIRNLKIKILRVPDLDEANMSAGDIIVISDWKTALKIEHFPEKLGKKIHFIQHDERMYHGEKDDVDKAFRLPFKKIVVSSWLKEVIERDYGQEAELLLNSVDRNLFYPLSNARLDSRLRGNDSGKGGDDKGGRETVRILLLHHTYEWKGTKEGVEIVNKLKRKYPGVKLILFGARKEKIEFVCDEYYYDLPQERLAELYSGCDIFLCPSWDEGFGLPSLEAMACKCALVTYDNGGSRDYAFDGETALVAKRRDAVDLESKIEALVKDADLRRKIAGQGYQFVQKMPSWEEQAEKLEKIFKQFT
jgi:glycosyltransferase involved in cell wall biosynthesis